ncbi:DegT/DnrJ/EryC1/StrS family aminotransferase [Methanococcoides sp. SA1]|nr:DegT/DnrJ/EryC1/StrS family aminotransferase [Methanococcoides sp. SA1]
MPGFEIIGKEEKNAINEIFDKSNGVLYRYGLDARRNNIFRVDDFERKLAEKVGSKYCLFVSNGTAALKLGLIALGVKAGDEVITQSFTFIATVEAILELGAIPVITEIDGSLNMDPNDLEKKITDKTKAIIPVHMGGVPAKMDKIMEITTKLNIPVLEDSAQALGASFKGKNLGTIGDAGIYSFDIGKVITAGEGGALVTDNEELYLKARAYSDHGHDQNPNFPRGEDTRSAWGFNYKVTELQGAIGLAQLEKLDYVIETQKKNKNYLKKSLQDIEIIEFREIPDSDGDASDTLIFYLPDRETAHLVASELSKIGIGTKNLPDAIDWHFAGTWKHIFGNYPEYKDKKLESVWPFSTKQLRRAVALPIMIGTTEDELHGIAEKVQAVLNNI